ncbi:MAG: Gfo/Idh/MocA family oxidoreductase [Planctomycetes bacterium]|nr:Gfo/Idh/MocA family oxidoreductase [Planctomycetota bacterium]
MRQGIVKKGKVFCEEVPAPLVSDGSVLIKVVNSCISAGTEMGSVVSSGRSVIKRILDQPEHIKKALNLIRSEGISMAFSKIQNKLDIGFQTGYSVSGIVIAKGKGVRNFEVGDHVAAAGAGIANHAEYVDVPINLVMKLPEGLDFQSASTVTLGGIALQGVRRVNMNLGEYCVVIGTGILGLLSIQLLRHAGARVAAVDLDNHRLSLAEKMGAEVICNPNTQSVVEVIKNWTGGFGADGVLICAATRSNEPLSQAFEISRKKGRIVLVGVCEIQIERQQMYQKEIDFKISTSYGPGRYDQNYEQKGLDYPYAYVRWTENRNMTEYLRLVRDRLITLENIIDHIYLVEKITEAFESLKNKTPKPLMVLLDYGKSDIEELQSYLDHPRKVVINKVKSSGNLINVALIGAGNFSTAVHLPNLQKFKDKYRLHAVVSKNGYKAKSTAKSFHAKYATTNYEDVFSDPDVDLVLIATRHDSHAELTLKALEAGKHVFVEKPLATNYDQLQKIEEFYSSSEKEGFVSPVLFAGFNRRFSKYSAEIKKHIDKRINPLFITYRMNAGSLPTDHWVHENGGRIVGEACHIIDLVTYFTQSRIVSVSVESLSPANEIFKMDDNRLISLKYSDGSVASIAYFAVGNSQLPKEYMEVHFDGKTIVMDDYKSLKAYGIDIDSVTSTVSQKGHTEELKILHDTLVTIPSKWPIDLWDMIQTTQTTLAIIE